MRKSNSTRQKNCFWCIKIQFGFGKGTGLELRNSNAYSPIFALHVSESKYLLFALQP
jgi:hypothetical protein